MAWAASFALGIVTVGWVFQSWLAGSTSTEHLAAERLIAIDAEAARLRAMSESLALEADWRAAVARRVATLRQLESRLDAFQQESAAPDPIAEAHRLIDQASLIMVTQADRMDREFGLTKSSARAFARAIELFPGALGATYARHRLKTLEHAIGDLL
ncbi:MAG: hypothetical protein ACE5GE_11040 [Phycisphaerae bacterium]